MWWANDADSRNKHLWKQVGKWRALERMQQLSPSGSLALVVWGPYSLDSSLLGSLKKKKPRTNRETRGERSLLGFSPGFVRRAPAWPVRAAAEVLGDSPAALLAADRAAPVKLAIATGHGLGAALLYRQPAVPAESTAAAALPAAQGPAAPQALSAFGAQQP